MADPGWTTSLILAGELTLRVGLSVRIIMRRRPVGVTHAWLAIVLLFPFVGSLVYLMFGELRLGSRPAKWAASIHEPYEAWLKGLESRSNVDWSRLGTECRPLARLTKATVGIPTLPGNELQLIDDTDAALRAIIRAVDDARRTVHMEFYIWHPGGLADDVVEAVVRAARRGVICRILVDAVGSRDFLRGPMVERLRQAGAKVAEALPGGLLRAMFVRFDLRLHRKIVVIDGQVAYTGSLNMVDPRFFKQEAGVGQWVDAMVRVRGPAVEGLAATFIEDWELETAEGIEQVAKTNDVHHLEPCGEAAVQVIPSGPLVRNEAIQRILLMAIYAARKELILTTPYFVPDESLVAALVSAASRGVDVTVLVPARVDSLLVRLASQAHKSELIAAGVRVALFGGGLLHTKSITVDGEFSLFGSLNFDPRSLHLNFEITLAVYDRLYTAELRKLQQSYIDRSDSLTIEELRSRSAIRRFVENTARLVSPLL